MEVQLKIKDCLACNLADKEKITWYLQWQTDTSVGICECDFDCACFDLEFEEDFLEHMDSHAKEIHVLRIKLYKAQAELLKEVF